MQVINRKGFTLLEILMVIVIIAILAALAIPQYLKVAKKGHASEAVSNIGDIKGAMMRYYAEHGTTTTNISKLDITDPATIEGATFDYSIERFGEPDNYRIEASGTKPATTGVCACIDTDKDTDVHVVTEGGCDSCAK